MAPLRMAAEGSRDLPFWNVHAGGPAMKKFFFQFLASALVLAIAAMPGALAQNAKGAISGRVTDASGSVLQGAEIELQPGPITTAAGTQGAYFMNNLNPGTYTITITYVGFTLFIKVVNVTAGENGGGDAEMGGCSRRGGGVGS